MFFEHAHGQIGASFLSRHVTGGAHIEIVCIVVANAGQPGRSERRNCWPGQDAQFVLWMKDFLASYSSAG